jgi:hypothetical protein
MTPQEQQQLDDRAAERAAVLAKFPDPSAEISDADCKWLTAAEVKSVINSGRLSGVGADRRIRGRA